MNAFIGAYVIVRSNLAGVFAGVVRDIDKNGDGTLNVTLTDARQLWRWWTPVGQGVSGVAEYGLADRQEVRIGAQMSRPKLVASVFQIDACTPVAETSIRQRAPVQ